MKIAVIGPGAMGTLFGVLLAHAGHETVMIDKDPERAARLADSGFLVEGASGKLASQLPVYADPAQAGTCRLVLVCVKAYDTPAAASRLAPLVGTQTIVLTLQNGLGNTQTLADAVGIKHVLAGSTAQGANVLEPGHVIHAGTGKTLIGELGGPATDRVRELANLLTDAGIPATPGDDVAGLLWGKLIINVGINPLTALLRIRNGALLERPETRQLMALAVEEAVAVAQALGVRLPFPDPLAMVEDVARRTGENKSSMYQDVLNDRRTEIDFICGAVVREAQPFSIPVPVNQTLTLLVKFLSHQIEDGE